MPAKTLTALGLVAAIVGATVAKADDLDNQLVIELKTGKVVIQMLPNVAPNHVERIKTLAREGFYDGVVFHRVIPGFMAQTGDPTGTGTGGSKLKDLKAEFNKEPFLRGSVGMARTMNPNSANSQFFIMFAPASHLNGDYTVWGRVIEGMENVDKLATGEPPATPDKMITVRVASDLAKAP